MAKAENKVVKDCLEYLNFLPFTCVWRNNAIPVKGRTFIGRKGVSDIIGIHDRRFIGIECKTLSGVLSPDQERFIMDIESNGGIALVVRSLDDLIRQIKELHNK